MGKRYVALEEATAFEIANSCRTRRSIAVSPTEDDLVRGDRISFVVNVSEIGIPESMSSVNGFGNGFTLWDTNSGWASVMLHWKKQLLLRSRTHVEPDDP